MGGYLTYTSKSQFIIKRSQRRNSSQDLVGRNQARDHGVSLLALLNCFLIALRTRSTGMVLEAYSELGSLHIIHQSRKQHSQIWWGHFIS